MKRKGVPYGYKHDWKYTVKKYKENKRGNFTEVQTKSRNRKTRTYGNLKRGSKIIWGLKGTFNTKRLKNGKYKTTYHMKKWKKRIKPKGKRWA